MTDDRLQMTDDRWQMTDDRWQMTDDRLQMTVKNPPQSALGTRALRSPKPRSLGG
jgi:hypothetical protein